MKLYVQGQNAAPGFPARTASFVLYYGDVARRVANPTGWVHACMSKENLDAHVQTMKPSICKSAAEWSVKSHWVAGWFDAGVGTGVHRVEPDAPASASHNLPWGGWRAAVQEGRTHAQRDAYLRQKAQQTWHHFDDCGLLGLYSTSSFIVRAVSFGWAGCLIGAVVGAGVWGTGTLLGASWSFVATVQLSAQIGACLAALFDPTFSWWQVQEARAASAAFKATVLGVVFAAGLVAYGAHHVGQALWAARSKKDLLEVVLAAGLGKHGAAEVKQALCTARSKMDLRRAHFCVT